MTLTAEQVVAACRAWTWIPDDARTEETEEYLLVRFPDYADTLLVVMRFQPTGDAAASLDRLLARAAETGLPEVTVWVKLGAPEGLDDVLVARGGTRVETTDVLACDLTDGVPELGASDVDVHWVAGEGAVDVLRDSHTVFSTVFGGEVPPDARLEIESLQARYDHAHGLGGGVVAYADGEPVGSGGITVADGVARLWSGSVVEEHRGRGVYRAMLGARLGYGVENGCSMGLVKGRIETSGPILRRAGFEVFGQERAYRFALTRP